MKKILLFFVFVSLFFCLSGSVVKAWCPSSGFSECVDIIDDVTGTVTTECETEGPSADSCEGSCPDGSYDCSSGCCTSEGEIVAPNVCPPPNPASAVTVNCENSTPGLEGFLWYQSTRPSGWDDYYISDAGISCGLGAWITGCGASNFFTKYYEGYLQVDEPMYYQFWVMWVPFVKFEIDVNGNGTIDDACLNGCYGNLFRVWASDVEDCGGWVQQYPYNPFWQCGSCFQDYWDRSKCWASCENGVNGPKTNECPLNMDVGGYFPYSYGSAYSSFMRYLEPGPHKIRISYGDWATGFPSLAVYVRKFDATSLAASLGSTVSYAQSYINDYNIVWEWHGPAWQTLTTIDGGACGITVCPDDYRITGTLFDASANDCSTIDTAPKVSSATVIATSQETGGYTTGTSNSEGVYNVSAATGNTYDFSFLTGALYNNQPVYACQGETASFVEDEDNISQEKVLTRDFGFIPSARIPWFQVRDSDVTSYGDVSSSIPACSGDCFALFDLAGEGGYPGVVVYRGDADFGQGEVSEEGWLVDSVVSLSKLLDVSFFERIASNDIVWNPINSASIEGSVLSSEGTETDGFYYFKYTGSEDLTISSDVLLGDRKIVLLVSGSDLYIGGNINLDDGEGMFLTLVGKDENGSKGNIHVMDTVGGGGVFNLEGLYFADGVFYTGEADTQLAIRGSVAGMTGISLERDLLDNSETPAEFIEFAPDQLLLYPSSLGVSRQKWEEVAP